MSGNSSGPGNGGNATGSERNGGLGSGADGLGAAIGGLGGYGDSSNNAHDGNVGATGSERNGGLGDGADGLGRALNGLGEYGDSNNRGNYGTRTGGFFDGGVLGSVLNGVNTLASLAVPGYAPIGRGISLANSTLGATNSLGLTNTGSIGPSFGDVGRMASNALSGAPGMGLGGAGTGSLGPAGPTGPAPSPADSGLASTDSDPTGMLGGLGHDGYDPLTQALVQQQALPAATTPATSMPVQPGVPDPRSLAGIMVRHNPMMPVQRQLI
jgi:hypothetical protein